MARESAFRVAIANANVPNMLGQISTAMAQAGPEHPQHGQQVARRDHRRRHRHRHRHRHRLKHRAETAAPVAARPARPTWPTRSAWAATPAGRRLGQLAPCPGAWRRPLPIYGARRFRRQAIPHRGVTTRFFRRDDRSSSCTPTGRRQAGRLRDQVQLRPRAAAAEPDRHRRRPAAAAADCLEHADPAVVPPAAAGKRRRRATYTGPASPPDGQHRNAWPVTPRASTSATTPAADRFDSRWHESQRPASPATDPARGMCGHRRAASWAT